jgi:hypothetical protein
MNRLPIGITIGFGINHLPIIICQLNPMKDFFHQLVFFKRPLRLGKPDLTVGSPEESHFLHQTKVATHVFFSGKDDDF